MIQDSPPVRKFQLEACSELRFEVSDKHETVSLELKSGLAEVFGSELIKGKKYQFSRSARVAVFSWQGCDIELVGKTETSYVARETPMSKYLGCHAAMETLSRLADKEGSRGPNVMVVGASDVGKSTLCRLLLNYAVRAGRRPIHVDLDVAHGDIAIPGSIGASLVQSVADVTGGFSQQAPLVYHFGHENPTSNTAFYEIIVSTLAQNCSNKSQVNGKVRSSGAVINAFSWNRDKAGYELLIHAARAFEVDDILVLDHELLHSRLVSDLPRFVNVVKLPKSGGVGTRSAAQKLEAREQSIKEYFYGSTMRLFPYSFEVKWNEAKLYKIGASTTLPLECLPFGVTPEDSSKKLVPVAPGSSLLHHILSVTFEDSPHDALVQKSVAGFLCVTNVDDERQTFTVLSPQPGPLPSHVLLLSDVQFMDSQ